MRNITQHEGELLKAKKTVLYLLLGFIYTTFICLRLGEIQAIADFNFRLHEMMYLPINLSIFIVPILLLIYVYLFIKTFKISRIHELTIKTKMKSLFVIVSLVAVFLIQGYQFQQVTTTGSQIINQKIQEGSKYYIVLDSAKVSVSRNEYNLVVDDERYMIRYTWNKNSPNIGKLEYIDPIPH